MTSLARLRVGAAALAALSLASRVDAQQPAPMQPRPSSPRDTVVSRPLTLGDAARIAARQSAVVQGANARTEQAEARVRESRSALLPQLAGLATDGARTFNSASFGLTLPGFDPNGSIIGPVRNVDLRARISQTVFDPAALKRVQAARGAARAFGAEAANSGEQAAATAASAYLRAVRTDAQLAARTADSALAADLLGIAQNQLQAGVGVGLDVTRARSQLATTRAQLIAARNDRDRARLDLVRALNLSLDVPLVLADSLAGLPTPDGVADEAAAVDRAVRSRPDIRAAEAQVAAARQRVSATRAERLPSLGLVADDGLNGAGYKHLLPTHTYGVQVAVPIFEGFNREGRVQEQEAAVREADVRLRDTRLLAAVEVRGALLDLASSREQVAAAQERLQLAQQEVSQARERFTAGVAGNADIVTASISLNNARTALIDAETAYQTARIAFARATGSVTELP